MQAICNWLVQVDHRSAYQPGFTPLDYTQQEKARFSLRLRYDRLAVPFANNNQIKHFPVYKLEAKT